MKTIVGAGLCIIGIIVWIASLIAATGIVDTEVVSLGVIIGGSMIMSGIALMCLPHHPKRVPYFDKDRERDQSGLSDQADVTGGRRRAAPPAPAG